MIIASLFGLCASCHRPGSVPVPARSHAVYISLSTFSRHATSSLPPSLRPSGAWRCRLTRAHHRLDETMLASALPNRRPPSFGDSWTHALRHRQLLMLLLLLLLPRSPSLPLSHRIPLVAEPRVRFTVHLNDAFPGLKPRKRSFERKWRTLLTYTTRGPIYKISYDNLTIILR